MNRTKSSRILSDFIKSVKRPRNQIATLSGLTNTYIRNLEKGEIVNVPRKRLVALGVALNLDLSEIDTLLTAFDRSVLTREDIPVFIETARNAAFSEAVLPVRDLFAYELILLSMEKHPGRQVIVNDRPTAGLMVKGHRNCVDREVIAGHPIYKDLNEAIGSARRDNLNRLLTEGHPIDHYICRQCLEGYLTENVETQEHNWRVRHVEALQQKVQTQECFNLFLTDTCFNLSFTMKLNIPDGGNDKLSYSARAPHDMTRGQRGRLNGFITENPTLCQCFREEYEQVHKTRIPYLAERSDQIAWLENLLTTTLARTGDSCDSRID